MTPNPPRGSSEHPPDVDKERGNASSSPNAERAARQYYVHYWHGISSDQINYWVFFEADQPFAKAEASRLIERAIKRFGPGYWSLVRDTTFPPEAPLFFRDGEGVAWGWDSGPQDQAVRLGAGEVLARKEKIEDWLEHPEPHRPKEVRFRLSGPEP